MASLLGASLLKYGVEAGHSARGSKTVESEEYVRMKPERVRPGSNCRTFHVLRGSEAAVETSQEEVAAQFHAFLPSFLLFLCLVPVLPCVHAINNAPFFFGKIA